MSLLIAEFMAIAQKYDCLVLQTDDLGFFVFFTDMHFLDYTEYTAERTSAIFWNTRAVFKILLVKIYAYAECKC